jgi:hypothetical protein
MPEPLGAGISALVVIRLMLRREAEMDWELTGSLTGEPVGQLQPVDRRLAGLGQRPASRPAAEKHRAGRQSAARTPRPASGIPCSLNKGAVIGWHVVRHHT